MKLQSVQSFIKVTAFLLTTALLNSCLAIQLNVLMVIVGENINNGFFACAPFFDIGFQEVAELFPQIFANATVKRLYQPNVIDCADSNYKMVPLYGKMLPLIKNDKDTMTVLFTPGTSDL